MKEMSQLVRILEGALFASDQPLSIDKLQTLFDEAECPEKKLIREALEQLAADYQECGVELVELASGFQFQVKADLSKWVQRLQEDKPPRYSRALLETLVLIAYRQPITRSEIEEIRGVVVSSNIVKTLMEREWIKEVGYRDLPGRPALLATTKAFLDYFGLKRLDELPPLSEIQDLDKIGANLEMQLKLDQESKENQEDSEENPERDEAINDSETNSLVAAEIVEDDEIDAEEIEEQELAEMLAEMDREVTELPANDTVAEINLIDENREITENTG